VNELSTIDEDWQAIEKLRAAVTEMDRLRACSLEVLNQSSQLLRIIDQINSPLIDTSSARQPR
jgi:hypothetical protein